MIKESAIEKKSLPVGWERKTLGDVSDFQRGLTYSGKDAVDFSGNIVLRATNIDLDKSCLDFSELKYLNNDFQVKQNKKIVKGGILICLSSGSKTHLGKVALVTDDYNYAFGGFIGQIIPDNQVISKYLFYNLISEAYKKYISELTDGIGINNLKSIDLKSFEFPLPSLPQQQQIVATLDKAFAAIDKAKANAEQNLKNAKELFESYLQNVFENKGDDWEDKSLVEVTSKIGSGATPRGGKANYKEVGISLIRSMNVHDFYFKEKNLAFIDDKQADALSNVAIQEEDVLLNITGASIARCCIVPKECLPARVNQHVSIIRANKEVINPVFLASLLTSKFFKDQILEIGEQGATRQAITKVQLENFEISFPKTTKEQEKVVQNINTLKAETKKLEAIYIQKIADLEEMKKSVLQKAFSGQLNTVT